MLNIKIKSEEQLTEKALLNIISKFNMEEKPRVEKLERYYKGFNDILNKKMKQSKPNNRVPFLDAQHTVDAETAYFLGHPITYESENIELMTKVQEMFDSTSEISTNMELSEAGSINGVGYELLYINPDNHMVELTVLDSANTFLVYDTNFKSKVIAGGYLEYYEHPETLEVETRLYLYKKDTLTIYLVEDKKLTYLEETDHFFNDVPIIPYFNNKLAVGSFEPSLYTIDARDNLLSNVLNDADSYADSYLVQPYAADKEEALQEVMTANLNDLEEGTTEEGFSDNQLEEAQQIINDLREIYEMNRDSKVILAPAGSEPYFLNKGGINHLEILAFLSEKYNKETATIDYTKESMGSNASGAALTIRMYAMEQVVLRKEGQFRKGLDKRLELIVAYLNFRDVKDYDYKEIVYNFKRKNPISGSEMLKFAKELVDSELISHETALAKSGIVEDPAYEIEKVKAEKIANI